MDSLYPFLGTMENVPDSSTIALVFDPRPNLVMQASTLAELEAQMQRDLHGPMDFHDFIVAHHERAAATRIAREMHMAIVRRVAARYVSSR